MKKFIPLLFITKLLFPMSSEEVDIESASSDSSELEIKIEDYYHQETKTLDFSNLPIKDHHLKEIIDDIKAIIVLTGAEKLILENNKLEIIPYQLITFALTNKTLKYVSFKNNNFKIQNGSECPEPIEKLIEKTYGKTHKKRSNSLGGIISTIWDGISPEIEKAIKESNKESSKLQLIKKIIIIDKRIPPITVINQDQLPKTTSDKCKDLFIKILYIGGGIVITLVPTLITYFTGNESCDIDALNNMMANCNLNSTL